MTVHVRLMEEADFDEADRVAQAAFERPISFRPMLRLHRVIEPEGLWVATLDDRIVGTLSCVDFGGVAYVGLMTVDPEFQRRGIARRLMGELLEWLDQRHCVALLDATDFGAPLYEQLGFQDDAFAYAYERVDSGKQSASGSSAARTATEGDLREIIAYDAQAFGANRAKLLMALWADFGSRCLVVRRDVRGNIAGYLFARDPLIGPWAADDPATAERLLRSALKLPFSQAPAVLVPRSNEQCRQLLARFGFRQQRRLRHMRRGGNAHPGCAARLYGQSSFGHG